MLGVSVNALTCINQLQLDGVQLLHADAHGECKCNSYDHEGVAPIVYVHHIEASARAYAGAS